MRTRAFGPTQGKTLPTPSGAGRARPVTDLSSLMRDSEASPDFTATPQRTPRQSYEFTPISQLPGGAPATGEEGGEAPVGGIQSAPLISPSQMNLSTLQRRVSPNRNTGPNDTQQGLDIASKGVKGLKGGIDTADFLKKAFGDAGFMNPDALIAPITEFLQNGGGSLLEGLDPSKFNFSAPDAGAALNPADFTFDMGSLNKLLPDLFGGESGAAGTAAGTAGAGAESLSSTLSSAAPYLNAALAALRIGQFATDSNLQDNQKAVGAAGAGLGALAPIAAGAAASAAGVGSAAAGATAAAPVAMILAQIASAIMDAMYDVPHDVREALDYFHSRGGLSGFREAVDQSFTLDDLWRNVLRQSSGYMGGGYPGQQSAFITSLGQPGNQRYVATGSRYPVVTMEDLLHDPEHTNVSWQHGLSDKYLAPTNDLLTKQFQSRLKLLGRAQEGDPEARVAVELARARYAAWMRQRKEIEANYQEAQGRQSREMVDVNAGDSGGAGVGGGPGSL